ncbi:hypothetical protein M409DRAFT_49905 [Zasmidium cellare ATCC 36951]|uniref:Uncharacterized protein n=1 Tax=Zasmidium cellare ATCC 36951 TaxID=1080233 RepID=A0A6A6D249_ZASCE|nr:uncharacterized protein M409DRAFT_49905 [Zasmidium cellare ATCC 36951]KAF2172169.1 hypothetical protein M409DRAFT_49905 [Zasmidium cellare ATCC 36951]
MATTNEISLEKPPFSSLKGKVIVLTGGASGIGAATVRSLHSSGALVVFGDVNADAGQDVLRSLDDTSGITFIPTNVTSYAANLKLFQTAHELHGRIDHSLAIAGVSETSNWFDAALTADEIAIEPDTLTLDVNLKAVLFFTRIALFYLRKGGAGSDRSITLYSSVAGFLSRPGLPLYQCSKHGVLGLLRAIKDQAYTKDGIRINAMCPGMTETNMTASALPALRAANINVQSAADVADFGLTLTSNRALRGKALLCLRGRAWDIEEGIERTMDLWLGETPSAILAENSRILSKASAWKG